MTSLNQKLRYYENNPKSSSDRFISTTLKNHKFGSKNQQRKNIVLEDALNGKKSITEWYDHLALQKESQLDGGILGGFISPDFQEYHEYLSDIIGEVRYNKPRTNLMRNTLGFLVGAILGGLPHMALLGAKSVALSNGNYEIVETIDHIMQSGLPYISMLGFGLVGGVGIGGNLNKRAHQSRQRAEHVDQVIYQLFPE